MPPAGLRFEAGAFDSNRAAAASGYLDVFRGIGIGISSAVRCLLPPGHVEKLTGALCEAYIAAHDDWKRSNHMAASKTL